MGGIVQRVWAETSVGVNIPFDHGQFTVERCSALAGIQIIRLIAEQAGVLQQSEVLLHDLAKL